MQENRNAAYHADNGALRYDEGKPQFNLLPSDGLAELGKVYTFGAKKYAPRNWERGMLWSRCYNSLLRHLFLYWDGEEKDAETGLHHMAHVVWNAMALLVYSLRRIGEDDRLVLKSVEIGKQNLEASVSEFKPGELIPINEIPRDVPPIIPVTGMRFLDDEGKIWIVGTVLSTMQKFYASSEEAEEVTQIMHNRAIKEILPEKVV